MKRKPEIICIESEETSFPFSKTNLLLGAVAFALVLTGLGMLRDYL